MQYTAIIKDGGLFIPNVFSDLNDGHAHMVQVTVDIEDVREQLSSSAEPKKQAPKQLKNSEETDAQASIKTISRRGFRYAAQKCGR